MNKKLLWIGLAMLMVTTPMLGQVNNNEDDEDDEDEIVVTDDKGREEVIEFPEAMTYDLDSLLNLYMAKTYLEEEDCNMRDINPVYSKEDYIGRLMRLPNVMEMVYNDVVQQSTISTRDIQHQLRDHLAQLQAVLSGG